MRQYVMVSKRFEAALCSSQVFLSFKMRAQQTDQRGKTEIAIHPIENDPIPAVAETGLMLLRHRTVFDCFICVSGNKGIHASLFIAHK